MNKLYIVLSLLFLINSNSWTQKNYLPGSVVDNNNAIIEGYINYKNWKNNPKKIEFKKTKNTETRYYYPLDIKSFLVSDERYISAIVEKETSPTDLGKLERHTELNLVVDTVFLQTLIQGPKNLYLFCEKNDKENFYIQDNESYDLLKYKKYIREMEGSQFADEYKMYSNQLTKYFQDCPSLSQACRSVSYDKQSMEEIFLKYYECKDEEMIFRKESEREINRISAIAGLNLTSLNISGTGFQYLVDADFSHSLGYTVGLSYEVILPRNRRKWSFVNDLILTSYSFNLNTRQVLGPEYFSDNTIDYSFTYLKMHHSGKYRFYQSKQDLFAAFGIGYGLYVQSENYAQREISIFSSTRIEEGEALREPRKHELSLHLGLGLSFDRFDTELRLVKGTGKSQFANLDETVTRLHFLFKYHI